MVNEVQQINEWLQKHEGLGQSPDNLPTLKQLEKIDKTLNDYSKRIKYIKDASEKLPAVRFIYYYYFFFLRFKAHY